ncbi:alpha-hydroxy acid oxidase [Ramlibacter sp. 2FC]|uniref:alpha-hydroxy acid oxidase n=1 Tax=Ramlibacter sp. 2FC TaxID=2502188 RepID=UPI0010F82A90|nr:alpha-hydroxy acid oxidase [Ramlibacter sp. 2FC]
MNAVNIEDLRRLARRQLPRAVFEFVDGAANDEQTLAANRRDFERIWFAPRVLVDVGERSQAVRVLGQDYASPFVFGPTGLAGVLWPHGDLATARATAKAGVGYCLSTNANASIEQVAQQGRKDFWFQLYVQRDRGLAKELVDRARAAGCPVLCVTVDLPVQGPRERDERNGFTVPPRLGLDNVFDYARRLGWLWRMATGPRIGFGNLEAPGAPKSGLTTVAQHIGKQFDPTVSWKEIDWLRGMWSGPLAVKGILHADDARLAVQHGVDAVIVSNHGGRQLDGAPSAISALPGIVDAVDGRAEVLVDGGVRRGSDIVKALALGARACLLGRASLYGLAAGGEAGVSRAIEILRKEIDITLTLLGRPDIAALNRSALRPGAEAAFWSPPGGAG